MQTNAALRHTPIELCRTAKNKRKRRKVPSPLVSDPGSDDTADMDMIRELHGTTVLICAEDGPPLAAERDVNDFLSAAWAAEATMVAIPVARLDPAFFQLATRLAGEVAQKFVNYRVRLAIVGNISAQCAQSKALCDFVHESNEGQALWFVEDLAALDARLAA
jgi:hypothetical protein